MRISKQSLLYCRRRRGRRRSCCQSGDCGSQRALATRLLSAALLLWLLVVVFGSTNCTLSLSLTLSLAATLFATLTRRMARERRLSAIELFREARLIKSGNLLPLDQNPLPCELPAGRRAAIRQAGYPDGRPHSWALSQPDDRSPTDLLCWAGQSAPPSRRKQLNLNEFRKRIVCVFAETDRILSVVFPLWVIPSVLF